MSDMARVASQKDGGKGGSSKKSGGKTREGKNVTAGMKKVGKTTKKAHKK